MFYWTIRDGLLLAPDVRSEPLLLVCGCSVQNPDGSFTLYTPSRQITSYLPSSSRQLIGSYPVWTTVTVDGCAYLAEECVSGPCQVTITESSKNGVHSTTTHQGTCSLF